MIEVLGVHADGEGVQLDQGGPGGPRGGRGQALGMRPLPAPALTPKLRPGTAQQRRRLEPSHRPPSSSVGGCAQQCSRTLQSLRRLTAPPAWPGPTSGSPHAIGCTPEAQDGAQAPSSNTLVPTHQLEARTAASDTCRPPAKRGNRQMSPCRPHAFIGVSWSCELCTPTARDPQRQMLAPLKSV